MKKIIALLTVLSSIFLSTEAVAQNQPLACQSDAAAGLSWENGQWVTASFLPTRFILVKTTDGLTKESVAKIFRATPEELHCRSVFKMRFSCSDEFGGHFFFDPATLKGGTAQIFATVLSDNGTKKDTPFLTAFSCTPF